MAFLLVTWWIFGTPGGQSLDPNWPQLASFWNVILERFTAWEADLCARVGAQRSTPLSAPLDGRSRRLFGAPGHFAAAGAIHALEDVAQEIHLVGLLEDSSFLGVRKGSWEQVGGGHLKLLVFMCSVEYRTVATPGHNKREVKQGVSMCLAEYIVYFLFGLSLSLSSDSITHLVLGAWTPLNLRTLVQYITLSVEGLVSGHPIC